MKLSTKSLVIFILFLLAVIAFESKGHAQTAPKPKCVTNVPTPAPTPAPAPTSTSDSTSSSTSNSASTATSSSTSTSGSTATGGSATATGGNATGGNSSASNGGNTQVQSYSTPRQAPMAYAPTVFSGACLGGFSAGASGPVGGVSFGGSKADKVCQSINLAQVFLSQGNTLAAAKVLCRTKPAREAKLTLDDCLAFVRPAPPVVETHVAQPTPTPTVIVIEPPITVTPSPEQLKEIAPAPKKPVLQSRKKPAVHKTCPVIPPSLKGATS